VWEISASRYNVELVFLVFRGGSISELLEPGTMIFEKLIRYS